MVEFVGEDRFESGAFEADIKAPAPEKSEMPIGCPSVIQTSIVPMHSHNTILQVLFNIQEISESRIDNLL